MAFCIQQDPDEYMIPYYSFTKNEEKHRSSRSQKLSFLKQGKGDWDGVLAFKEEVYQWLYEKVSEFENDTVVITVAPGHKKNPNPTGFMHEMVKEVSEFIDDVHDGGQQLIRIKSVSKQAQTRGPRSEDTHRGTIDLAEIDGKYPDNSGKIVIILDDVWTSGSTLRVCKEVIEESNPKEVKLFVIGKTTDA